MLEVLPSIVTPALTSTSSQAHPHCTHGHSSATSTPLSLPSTLLSLHTSISSLHTSISTLCTSTSEFPPHLYLSTPLSLFPLTQNHPWVPSLVQTLSQILPQWRRDHAGLPVLTWANFYNKVVDCINPLASEEKTRVVASALHDTGEVRELWGVVYREKEEREGRI